MTDICVYQIDNELLLFSQYTKNLYGLNTLSSYIWLCLEENLTVDETVVEIAAQFQISIGEIKKDIHKIYNELNNLRRSTYELELTDAEEFNFSYESYLSPLDKTTPYQKTYHLLDTLFLVRYENKRLLDAVQPAIEHMEVASATPDMIIDIIEKESNCLLLKDNMIINQCRDSTYLLPVINYEITRLAYQSSNYLLAVHSAVVGHGQSAIMLPGLSGSGKSTLTAALVHAGFSYFSDEVAMLKPETYHVVPVPTCIGIKKNSWEVLAHMFPELMEKPIHSGVEGRKIRFFLPDLKSTQIDKNQGKPVASIVFPQYLPDSSVEVQSLNKVDALKRLTDAGYQTQNSLTANKVSQLVKWISSIECYSLVYSDLPDAVDSIRSIANECQK